MPSLSGIWPTLRLVILAFNLLFIINLIALGDKEGGGGGGGPNQRQQQQQHHVITHHETSLLSECSEDAFVVQKTPPPDTKKKGICSKLLPEGATAASLWTQNAAKILKASIHPADKDGVHVAWTESLLRLLSPDLLERGLRTQPNHKALKRVSQIIQEKLKNPETAPPLEVAVVGGSVTEGGGCQNIPNTIQLDAQKEKPTIQGNSCAWPLRLQLLLDAIMGEGVIRVHNLAVGGTNSNLATPVLDYWLFPENSPLLVNGPDVIINGYAANDNLPPAHKRGDDTNMTGDFEFFYKYGMGRVQEFIRTSLFSRPCLDDPLVLFVDEYLGNQHNLVLGELFRFEAVDVLTSWYGQAAGAISPAQVVRRMIYADTEELIFTAPWKKPRGEKRVDVHFGMPGHVHIAWTVAYSFLTMALNFCEEETSRPSEDTSQKFIPAETMELVEQDVPPFLDAELQVDDVRTKWKEDTVARQQSEEEYCSDVSNTKPALPCSFAFVAAPMGTVKNAGALNNYVGQFVVSNNGWSGQQDIRNGWQNKLGYVAEEGASLLLRIDKTPNKVKTVTLHTLKSYGEKWAGSKAHFGVSWTHPSGSHYNTSFEIEGFHNQNTSIAYPFILDLGPDHIADKGSTFDIQIDLIGGTTFKINAMMVCSR